MDGIVIKLEINRIYKGPKYTIGKLYVNGKYFCDTLEDPDRGLDQNMSINSLMSKKVYSDTAIPTGSYKISMNMVSPRFGRRQWARPYKGIVPRLLNVPAFDGVLIHPGNTARDTSGCILVGENKVVGKVINSVNTYHKLMKILKDDVNNIIIVIK